jgi:hypothetical protein
LLSSSEHSGVPEDSKPPTFPSVGLHPHTWPKWGCDKEAHITETSKIEHCPEDVKIDENMVDVDTSKQVSPTNLHVLEVTPQVLRINNSVL